MDKDMYRVTKNQSGIEIVLDTEFEYLVPLLYIKNNGNIGLWGRDLQDNMVRAEYSLPKWLSDGIRKLLENGHKCKLPDMIDWDGYECSECGQIWGAEEVEPGAFVWTRDEEMWGPE